MPVSCLCYPISRVIKFYRQIGDTGNRKVRKQKRIKDPQGCIRTMKDRGGLENGYICIFSMGTIKGMYN